VPALRPLVAKYGAAFVWNVGLEDLGYPPTWCYDGKEVVKLKDAIAKRTSLSV
jgi:hypothetical protein